MNAFMHLVDDHLVPSLGILHIHVIFWNSYNIHVIDWCSLLIMYYPFIFLNFPLWFHGYKREHWIVCKTHNNREELYIVFEELASHIAIPLSYLIIFFHFTTLSQFLITRYLINMIDITMRIWFSYLMLANMTFEKYNYCKIQLFQKYYSYKNDYLKNNNRWKIIALNELPLKKLKSEIQILEKK